MMKNYVGRCVDCESFLNCETVDDMKEELTARKFQIEINTPRPCPDYEFVGE